MNSCHYTRICFEVEEQRLSLLVITDVIIQQRDILLTENHHLDISNRDVNAYDYIGHDDTEGVCGIYEDIDLDTATNLTTSIGVNAGILRSGDSSREGSIGRVSDSSSDLNSSKKRNRYEELLLERSPIIKRVYLRFERSQNEQEMQTTNPASSNENVTESSVYLDVLP